MSVHFKSFGQICSFLCVKKNVAFVTSYLCIFIISLFHLSTFSQFFPQHSLINRWQITAHRIRFYPIPQTRPSARKAAQHILQASFTQLFGNINTPSVLVTQPTVNHNILIFRLKAVLLPKQKTRRLWMIAFGHLIPSRINKLIPSCCRRTVAHIWAGDNTDTAIGMTAQIPGAFASIKQGIGLRVICLAGGYRSHQSANIGVTPLHHQWWCSVNIS